MAEQMSDDAARMRKTRLWKQWKAEPAAQRWTPVQENAAERLLESVLLVDGIADVRERRLQLRDIAAGEARLGLTKPVPTDEDEEDIPAEPREAILREADLGLLYPSGVEQFVHPPPTEGELYPSLGPQVVRWIEANLCHGPGSLRGEPATVSDEWLAFLTRAYELFPRGHELEGQRRFRDVRCCRRKGTAKTEVAAWVVCAEMHPDAPVRFDGWEEGGLPRGQGVVDPRVFLLATTEQQSSALTYSAVQAIIKGSPTIRDDFRITDAFLMREDGSGLCEPVTGSPSARDGERTTLNVYDEGHRLVGDRLGDTVNVMQGNLPKRTDSWSLGTTTGWEPGMESRAEWDDRRAREGTARSLFYLHCQARDGYDLKERADALAALEEASGESWKWMDHRAALQEWEGARDKAYWERVHLCRSVASSTQAFPMTAVLAAQRPERRVSRERSRAVMVGGYGVQKRKGTEVVIGFDGSQFRDHTALVGCTLDGFLFTIGIFTPQDGRIDKALVNSTLHKQFEDLDVRLFLGDDSGWSDDFARWAGRYGKVVKRFQKQTETPYAVRNLIAAFENGDATYDGREVLTGELANARRRAMPGTFPDGSPKFTIGKGQDRTRKIDGAMAATIAWDARRVVLSTEVGKGPKVSKKADDYPDFTTHGGFISGST